MSECTLALDFDEPNPDLLTIKKLEVMDRLFKTFNDDKSEPEDISEAYSKFMDDMDVHWPKIFSALTMTRWEAVMLFGSMHETEVRRLQTLQQYYEGREEVQAVRKASHISSGESDIIKDIKKRRFDDRSWSARYAEDTKALTDIIDRIVGALPK